MPKVKCSERHCRKKAIWKWIERSHGDEESFYCAEHFECQLLMFVDNRTDGEIEFTGPDQDNLGEIIVR